MESQISELLEKYWNGDTSLTEEEELKAYFRNNPSLTPTGLFFRGLQKESEIESRDSFSKPGGWFTKTKFSIAASIAVGITVGAFVLMDSNSRHNFEIEDPEEAYKIAQTVLMKMSSNLNEAQTHTVQLKKINKAEELITEEQL